MLVGCPLFYFKTRYGCRYILCRCVEPMAGQLLLYYSRTQRCSAAVFLDRHYACLNRIMFGGRTHANLANISVETVLRWTSQLQIKKSSHPFKDYWTTQKLKIDSTRLDDLLECEPYIERRLLWPFLRRSLCLIGFGFNGLGFFLFVNSILEKSISWLNI